MVKVVMVHHHIWLMMPLFAGSYFVTALQTVVSRRLSPFETGVVTIGSFDGKGQFNVIKDVVEIEGDVRGLTDATKATIEKELNVYQRIRSIVWCNLH